MEDPPSPPMEYGRRQEEEEVREEGGSWCRKGFFKKTKRHRRRTLIRSERGHRRRRRRRIQQRDKTSSRGSSCSRILVKGPLAPFCPKVKQCKKIGASPPSKLAERLRREKKPKGCRRCPADRIFFLPRCCYDT